MNGILSYGVYVPFARLDRKTIAEALGSPAGSGTRAVASYDEDTTSMGVEAARVALRSGVAPSAVVFATAAPAYLDKTNATAIHAALDLADAAPAYDMAGSIRSGAGAMWAALNSSTSTLAVLSDVRTGLAGGADERESGDAAAAFVCGPGDSDHPPAHSGPPSHGSGDTYSLHTYLFPKAMAFPLLQRSVAPTERKHEGDAVQAVLPGVGR